MRRMYQYHSCPVPRVPTRDIASAVFMVTTFVLHLSRTSHPLDVEDFILMPSVRIIIYQDTYFLLVDYHSLLLKIRHTQIDKYLDWYLDTQVKYLQSISAAGGQGGGEGHHAGRLQPAPGHREARTLLLRGGVRQARRPPGAQSGGRPGLDSY